jgi:hypothetical protein
MAGAASARDGKGPARPGAAAGHTVHHLTRRVATGDRRDTIRFGKEPARCCGGAHEAGRSGDEEKASTVQRVSYANEV